MCCFTSLYQNEHGYVVRCNHCRHFHVAFGNVMLALTSDQFYEFALTIEDSYRTNQYTPSPDVKSVQVSTAARTVMLMFSVNELEKFTSILHHAKDKLKKETLFVFHEN